MSAATAWQDEWLEQSSNVASVTAAKDIDLKELH